MPDFRRNTLLPGLLPAIDGLKHPIDNAEQHLNEPSRLTSSDRWIETFTLAHFHYYIAGFPAYFQR